MATVMQSTPTDQVLGEPGVRFNSAKFFWIGSPIVDNLVTLSTTASGLRDLEDVKKSGGLICGSSGAGPTLTFPNILNHLLPTDARVVSGYPGDAVVDLALERGEVNCIGGTGWSSMKATMSEMMRDKQLNVLVQWGTAKDQDIRVRRTGGSAHYRLCALRYRPGRAAVDDLHHGPEPSLARASRCSAPIVSGCLRRIQLDDERSRFSCRCGQSRNGCQADLRR